MTTLRKAAQAALEALDEADGYIGSPMWSPSMQRDCRRAAQILRAALAEFDASLTDPALASVHQTAEPAQPVAWRSWTGQCGYGYWESQTDADLHSDPDYRPVPLYAAPPAPAAPARLTDEDFVKIAFPYLDGALMEEIEMDGYALLEILRAVEAEVLRRMGVVE